MVDPCASGVLERNAVVVKGVTDLNVADDDVSLIDSRHATAEELCTVLMAEQGLVAADTKACLAGQVERALGHYDQRIGASKSGTQSGQAGYGSCAAAFATGGFAQRVIFCETLEGKVILPERVCLHQREIAEPKKRVELHLV